MKIDLEWNRNNYLCIWKVYFFFGYMGELRVKGRGERLVKSLILVVVIGWRWVMRCWYICIYCKYVEKFYFGNKIFLLNIYYFFYIVI